MGRESKPAKVRGRVYGEPRSPYPRRPSFYYETQACGTPYAAIYEPF